MQCPNCNTITHPPEPVCPHCGHPTAVEEEPSSPRPISAKSVRKISRELLDAPLPQVPRIRLPGEIFRKPTLGWPLRLSLIAWVS